MSFDNTVARTARELRNEKGPYRPSPTLRQRTLEQISAVESPRLSSRILTAPLSGAGAIAMAVVAGSAAVVGGYSIFSHLHRSVAPTAPPLPGVYGPGIMPPNKVTFTPEQTALLAQVQAAVNHANSWHIIGPAATGYHEQTEIWGRAHPFFFRAQIGSEIIVDDGTTRTHILPVVRRSPEFESLPVEKRLQLGGTATLRSSLGKYDSDIAALEPQGSVQSSLSRVFDYEPLPSVSLNRNGTVDGLAAVQLTLTGSPILSDTLISRKVTASLFVDPVTHFPRKYTKSEETVVPKANMVGRQTYNNLETTTASYNVEIPESLKTIKLTPEFEVVDMRGITQGSGSAQGKAVEPNITIHPIEVAQDSEGNVRILCDLYHDGRPYTRRVLTSLLSIGTVFDAEDEHNCVYLRTDASHVTGSNHIMLYMTPQAPFKQGARRPNRLTIHLPIWPSTIDTHMPEAPPLPMQWIEATVTLPAQPAALPEPSDWQFPADRPQAYNPVISADIARAQYYAGAILREKRLDQQRRRQSRTVQPTDTTDPSALRDLSIFWWNAAATEAERLGNRGETRQFHYQAALVRKGTWPTGH